MIEQQSSIDELRDDLVIIREAIRDAAGKPQTVEVAPGVLLNHGESMYVTYRFKYSDTLVTAARRLAIAADILGLPRDGDDYSFDWLHRMASGFIFGADSLINVEDTFDKDCLTWSRDLDALAWEFDRLIMTGQGFGAFENRSKSEAVAGADIQEVGTPRNPAVATIAGRLNDADREVIQALVELDRNNDCPATGATIAKRSGRAPQETKETIGAMFRYGLLDKGPKGHGFMLSASGIEVATLVSTEVATRVGTDSR